MLGRIVSLAATLENKILSFYQYLVGRSQTEQSELSVSQHNAKSVKELQRLKELEGCRKAKLNWQSSGSWRRKRSLEEGTTTSTASVLRRVMGSCSAGACSRGRAVSWSSWS